MLGTALLALLAGALSTLSPCVLPLLPIVLGMGVTEHRNGPVALAEGAVDFDTRAVNGREQNDLSNVFDNVAVDDQRIFDLREERQDPS